MRGSEGEGPFDQGRASGGEALPAWLLAVYASLLAWGAWYLVRFWSGPGPAGP